MDSIRNMTTHRTPATSDPATNMNQKDNNAGEPLTTHPTQTPEDPGSHYALDDRHADSVPNSMLHTHGSGPVATPRTDAALRATQGMFRAASASNGFTDFARQLERELAAEHAKVVALRGHCQDWEERCASAQATIGELRKDKERLDWLEMQTMHPEEWADLCDKWRFNGKRYPEGLRAAIDAAMQGA